MFEERQKRNWNWTWAGIASVVLILIAVIQVVRVNPPTRSADSPVEGNPVWTEGKIFDGVAEIPANGFLSFPVNLNRKATFKGFFRTGSNDRRLGATIIKSTDLENWKAGNDVAPIVSTGPVPRGFITRVIEPGNYFLLIDNRMNAEAMKLVETDFSVE